MPLPSGALKSVTSVADVALPLATETVIATLPGVSVSDPSITVSLAGRCHAVIGAAGTTATLRIRRTSLTGTLVGEGNPINTPVSTTVELIEAFDDQPGDVASLVYVLTCTLAGSAGNTQDQSLVAMLHS